MLLVDTTNITNISNINKTLGFPEAGYWFLVTYHSLVLLLTVIGNLTVFASSRLYNEVNVDSISIVFVEMLAILDLIIAFSYSLPVAITLAANKFILGAAVCFIQGNVSYITIFIQLITIQTISLYKLFTLLRPLSSYSLTSKQAKLFVAGVTAFSTFYMFCCLVMGQFYYFDPYLLSCQISGQTDPRKSMVISALVALVLFVLLPITTILLSNAYILRIVYRSSKKKSKMPSKAALTTLTSISLSFLIFTTPTFARVLLQTLFKGTIPSWYFVTQLELLFLNSATNPIIYTFTNTRFRRFLNTQLQKVVGRSDQTLCINYNGSSNPIPVDIAIRGVAKTSPSTTMTGCQHYLRPA
ncbi:C-C chemokine receptor type 4-like [Bolinopsis microptera]|uniref:C-C chemokine receptor type 4-like n=1 Tax=Bolinopsis microptera TaxID=2820187 RepID=UPI00307A2088